MKKKNKTNTVRKGPLSNLEKKDIADWSTSLDCLDIAQRLNRAPKQVETFLRDYLANAPKIIAKKSATEEIRRELRSSAAYSAIKEQFTERELVFYENSYIDYRLQIVEITPVEIKQIYQLIDLDIRVFRHNKDTKHIREEIDRLEAFLEKEHKRDIITLTQDEKTQIAHAESQLLSYKAMSSEKTREHRDLLSKHGDILKSLKATRDQRIKNLEGQGKFMELLHKLEIESLRMNIGQHTALAEMAKVRELERLATPIQYDDGMLDQPILSYETNNKEYE